MTQTEQDEQTSQSEKTRRGRRAGETKRGGQRVPNREKPAALAESRPKPAKKNTAKPRKKAASPAPRPTMTQGLVIGGLPRVDLLPPEVRAMAAAKRMRGRLVLAILAVIVLVIAGSGGASLVAVTASSILSLEQAQTQSLLAQQGKYISVRTVQTDVSMIEAARRIGTSTEIDWKAYLNAVQKTLPGTVTIDTVTIDSESPLATYAQPTAPLQGARVATLAFSATSPTLPKVPTWLNGLATLPGFADALPGSVTQNPDGSYTVKITMHINDAAFLNRFAKKGK